MEVMGRLAPGSSARSWERQAIPVRIGCANREDSVMASLPKHVLVVQRTAPYCSDHQPAKNAPSVTVESIEESDPTGWKLRGTGHIASRCIRPGCTSMCDLVRAVIPIECESYSCPRCGE